MAEQFDQSSVQVQAAVDAALTEQKKKKKKKKLIIFAVVLAVIIAVAALASSGDDDAVKPVDSGTSTSDSAASDTKADKKQTTTEAKTSFKVGEAVQVHDVKISYTGCDADCRGYSKYSAPDSGMKYVKATFTFENTGDSDVSLDNFDCYADDTAYEEEYFAFDDYKSPTLESISPGRKFNAVVYYQVPKDAQSIVLEYETSYFSSNHIEFVIE